MVEVELAMADGDVEVSRVVRLRMSSSSIRRNWRILLLEGSPDAVAPRERLGPAPLRLREPGSVILNFFANSGIWSVGPSSLARRFSVLLPGSCCSAAVG